MLSGLSSVFQLSLHNCFCKISCVVRIVLCFADLLCCLDCLIFCSCHCIIVFARFAVLSNFSKHFQTKCYENFICWGWEVRFLCALIVTYCPIILSHIAQRPKSQLYFYNLFFLVHIFIVVYTIFPLRLYYSIFRKLTNFYFVSVRLWRSFKDVTVCNYW